MSAPTADIDDYCDDEPLPALPSQTPRLDAALHYAEHGIYVFPLRVSIVNGRKKCTPITNWDDQSTTDEGRIRFWFGPTGMYRNASLAIDCGKSGLVVVDPDGEIGLAAWREFCVKYNLGGTWVAHTPGGGQHWYYREDPERPVRNTASKLAEHVDTRGAGGFVIAPPSRDARGPYRWGAEGEPEWYELPVVPVAVPEALRPPERPKLTVASGVPVSSEVADRYAAAALAGELRRVRESREGGQNDQLNKSAFSLGRLCAVGALDPKMVRTELIRASIASGYPARDGENSMIKAIDSGLRGGYAKPRTPWPPVSKIGSDYYTPTADEIAAVWLTYGPDGHDEPHIIRMLLGDDAQPPAPALEPAADDELEAWIKSFTRYRSPARLYRRIEWMARGDLAKHAAALVEDTLNGDYLASLALTELAVACRKRGDLDTATPQRLLSAALGAALDAKAVTR